MMKRAVLPLLLVLFAVTAWGQKIKGFDFDKFHEWDEEAQWLVRYDRVAWITSDSVSSEPEAIMEALDGTWFCVPGQGDVMWWAFYGRMEQDSFVTVISYFVDTLGKVHKNNGREYDRILNQSIATAITNASKAFAAVRPAEHAIRHNVYVRLQDDATIKVWILPAFQPDGTAVYGGDYAAVFNSEGNKLISEDYHFLPSLYGFKPGNKEIEILYTQYNTPPLGAIFFLHYYAPYFKTIYVRCAKSLSTYYKDGDKGYWIHAEAGKKGK